LSLQQAASLGSDTLLDSNRPEASLSDDEYQSIQNKKKQKSSLRSEAGRDESEAAIEFGHIRKDSAADSSVPNIQDDSNWLRSKTGQLLGLQDEQDEQDQAEFPAARPHSAHRGSPDAGAEPNEQQGSRALAVKPVGTPTPAATDEAEDQIRKSKRLFLRNLPFTITEEALMEHFSSYGGVEEVCRPPFHFANLCMMKPDRDN
jgi:multiple RNA-binding domain-containing protein 1